MAVSNKTRRKIAINGDLYIWFVHIDGSYSDIGSSETLHIKSDDKKFAVSYPINQTGTHNLISLQFLQAGERTIADGICRHVECPGWEKDKPVTTGIVRKVILWCLQDRDHIDVDHLGELEAPVTKTGHLRLVVSN